MQNQAVQVLAGAITTPVAKWSVDLGSDFANLLWASAVICDINSTYPENEVLIKANPSTSGNTILYALRGTDGATLWTFSSFGQDPSTPACADIDGDGLDEVITRTFSDGLKAIDNNGTVLWTYPTTYSFSSPKVADVVPTSPGPEIIFMDPNGSNLFLYVLSSSGTLVWSANVGIAEQPAATPAIDDIDGDGVLEIVISTLYSGLRVYNGQTGTLEWSYFLFAMNPTPSIIDLNGDGVKDILFSDGSTINAISGTGTFMWSFDLTAHAVPDTHVLLMEYVSPVWDINSDGFPEIFVGDGGDSSNVNSHLLRLDQNGTSASINWLYGINQWAYDGGGGLVDVDNDGLWDFIKSADNGYVYAVRASNGTLVWNFRFDDCGSGVMDPSLAIGDIDADNCSEVVILGCKSAFLINSIRAIAIDNSTPVSACAVLSRDDELSAVERTPIRKGYSIKGNTIVLFEDSKIWRYDGKLIGNYRRGSKITLKHGVYFIKSGNRVSKVVIK